MQSATIEKPIQKIKDKVLLLNLPGKQTYLRDYYCNNISKSSYIHYPVDLLYLTGTLESNNYDVYVEDALLKKYSPEETFEKIEIINPDFLVCLVGTISWEEDKKFLKSIKERFPLLKIIGTGDIFLDEGVKTVAENDFFNACILDFSDETILKVIKKLKNQGEESEIENCIYRINGSSPVVGKVARKKGEFSLATPRHEYFELKSYKYAFSRNFPTAHLLTDFGCAFNCSFCPIRIDNLGFKVRPVDEIIEEMKYLKSLGMKELYFRDQTFGANKKRAIDLCNRMIEEGLKFSWHCFSRVDVINEELVDAMAKSGCHTIIFGIESSHDDTLGDVQKRITREKI